MPTQAADLSAKARKLQRTVQTKSSKQHTVARKDWRLIKNALAEEEKTLVAAYMMVANQLRALETEASWLRKLLSDDADQYLAQRSGRST